MSKLFAMEDINNDVVGEMETTPEMGEAADVQASVDEGVGDMGEATIAIDEGMGAVDQLEQVEQVVETAAEGEGLDPVAAEAIRIAVEAICARVGADSKKVFNLYAAENFNSASSRKANTKIALEGVGEFLKDMWKKIKAALQRLWEKAREFWDKHVSSLGRIKKALTSAKSNLGNSSGKLKDKAFIEEAPSALMEAFGFKKDISVAEIKNVIKVHNALTDNADKINAEIQYLNSMAEASAHAGKTDIDGMMALVDREFKFGTSNAPMVGGVYITYKFQGDKSEGTLDLDIEREKVDRESKLGVSLSDKAALQDLIKETIHVIDNTIRYRDKTKKIDEATNKFFVVLEKRIVTLSDSASPEDVKEMRKIMKMVYKSNAKAPQLNAEILSFNVKLGKAVLGYVALCVKNYK